MASIVSVGNQAFDSVREQNCFYIDKTYFIKEWWESKDIITLITRPRRFGKTLNMSMLNCFFSNRYENRADLFDGLFIWNEEQYRKLQGTYPVLFLSFAAVKAENMSDAKKQIKAQIMEAYKDNRYLLEGDFLDEGEKKMFNEVSMDMGDAEAYVSLNLLCKYLARYYDKKVIVLLDEYDTPMQEAYVNGYWNEFTAFARNLFNAVFKTNLYLERAVMTGITRVSKESIFSDLNNLNVVTATSEEYATCFGFTEKEVFGSLNALGLEDYKEKIRQWYDGFVFGGHRDIYNPWSITNFLDKKRIMPYWASTSSNKLINNILKTASPRVKELMELLMNGENIEVTFDEQIVYDQLDRDENAIWSLLVASGYLKIERVLYKGEEMIPVYNISITNQETKNMFSSMFRGWFGDSYANYNEFVDALLRGNLKEMNRYMNDVALTTFSSFDSGSHPSEKTQPERFYHGFVLGLLVELRDKYEVRSNRESGYGRYDVMLISRKRENAIIIEFKVHDEEEERTLQDTAIAALAQINEKEYDTELVDEGIDKDHIVHYGFAFEGKKVLILAE